jgi:hypothetical protein
MTFVYRTVGPASIPLKQSDNNNLTTARMGMPFKPNTMTQGSDFASARFAYINNVGNPSINSVNSRTTTTTYTNRPIKVVTSNSNSIAQLKAGKKKNYNVSSSEQIYLKKINAVGKSSTKTVLPSNAPMSFSGVDQTSVRDALTRCRAGGCVAPKKKGANY